MLTISTLQQGELHSAERGQRPPTESHPGRWFGGEWSLKAGEDGDDEYH